MASEALVASVDGPQPPVDGQVPGPEGPVVEREICVICHDELDVHDTDNLMVLWCDHKFHKHCILEWRTVARRSERNCPFRCETSERLTQPLLALILDSLMLLFYVSNHTAALFEGLAWLCTYTFVLLYPVPSGPA